MNGKEGQGNRTELHSYYTEKADPIPIDWEQRKWDLAKEIFSGGLNSSDSEMRHWVYGHLRQTAEEAIQNADVFIEEYRKRQTNKTE